MSDQSDKPRKLPRLNELALQFQRRKMLATLEAKLARSSETAARLAALKAERRREQERV